MSGSDMNRPYTTLLRLHRPVGKEMVTCTVEIESAQPITNGSVLYDRTNDLAVALERFLILNRPSPPSDVDGYT